MSHKPSQESTKLTNATLAVVLQVRHGRLHVLLWQRARDPDDGAWALPGGALEADETLPESIRRHLAAKVDVREVGHLEQLGTWGDPGRVSGRREIATAYLGLVPLSADPDVPADTHWHPLDDLPTTAFDHGLIVIAGRERLRAKLSYSNAGFALAPPSFTLAELRAVYVAALGYDVSATNLRRVLERRALIVPTGDHRSPGRAGGRPAEVFRFRSAHLSITDPFATLRPRE
jgi:hypothetical protein